jgi:hypothetical protein
MENPATSGGIFLSINVSESVLPLHAIRALWAWKRGIIILFCRITGKNRALISVHPVPDL